MKHEIELREFMRSDNAEYSTWFVDPSIEKYLGPAWTDQELDEIFAEEHGSVLSAYISNQLVGIVSLALPHQQHKSFGITGIAVNPKRNRTGVGACILQALCGYYNTPTGQEWLAYIDPLNTASQSFLVSCGWEKGGLENDFYRYTFKQKRA